jgi:drug/metabolite transporter (DMT)-like permease
LFILVLYQGKLNLIKSFSRDDLKKYALLGFLNPCLYYIILFKAYDVLPAQEAMVINFSWPVMLVILSIPILKQTIDVKSFLSIIVCYLGVVVIATNGDIFSMQFVNPFGVFLMLISTVIWSLFWLFNTKNSNDSLVSLFLIFLFSFPLILVFVLFTNSFVVPSFKGLIGSIYIGFFEMGISLVLWQSALKISTTVSRVASLVFITPFMSLVVLYFVLGEKILVSTFFGLILICTGLILQKYFTNKMLEDS